MAAAAAEISSKRMGGMGASEWKNGKKNWTVEHLQTDTAVIAYTEYEYQFDWTSKSSPFFSAFFLFSYSPSGWICRTCCHLTIYTYVHRSMYNVYRSSTFVSNNNERVVYISVSVCVEWVAKKEGGGRGWERELDWEERRECLRVFCVHRRMLLN